MKFSRANQPPNSLPIKDHILALILVLWISLRILSSIWIAMVSNMRPFTGLEQAVPLWPPSSPVSVWLNRALISPWERWDTNWYNLIVTDGYHLEDGTAQFHPLYPWLATPLAQLGINPVLSLLIVSSISGILLFWCFFKLASLDFQPESALISTILFATTPVAMILMAPYPEALFLLAAVLCLLWARQDRWLLAGTAGALAMLTRQQGIFLMFPLGWELWVASKKPGWQFKKTIKCILALAMIPAAWGLWDLYRAVALSDFTISFHDFHSLVYTFFISPSADKVVPVQKFLWPWQGINLAIDKLIHSPDLDIYVNLVLAAWFLLLLGLAWRKLRTSYRIYCLAIAGISFSYYTGPAHPYMGLPRHLLLAFPVFISLTPTLPRPFIRLLWIFFTLFCMLFLLLLLGLELWVP